MSGAIVVKPSEKFPNGAIMDIMDALREGIINMDDLGAKEFQQIQGKLKRVRDDVLYYFFRLQGARVLPRGRYPMFNQPVGGRERILNNQGAADFQLNFSDTNLRGKGGSLTQGTAFAIQSIQVPVLFTSAEDTAMLTATNTAIDPTPVEPSTAVSASNLAAAVVQNVGIAFEIDQVFFEEGPAWLFPSEFVLTGSVGGAEEGFVQNGGRARHLSRIRHLKGGQPFIVHLDVYSDVTVTRSGRLGCALVGKRYQPVTG